MMSLFSERFSLANNFFLNCDIFLIKTILEDKVKKIVAKKVSMLELFYDLIFVYAISKITAMIHHPVHGILPVISYIEFIFVVIIVMQIWLYQALYINRFGRNRMIDTVGLLISMFAVTYLANNINTEWSFTFYPFNSSVLLIIASLIGQYLFGSGKHPFYDQDVRAFIITLGLEFVIVLIGLLLGYRYGIYLCVIGGLIGFVMPLTIYHQFASENVNFPHLVERLSLIIIITFGETLVNITRYFNGALFTPFSIAIFILIASMFGLYIVQSDLLINHHQKTRGFVAMYSHVFMVMMILSMTVGLDYLADKEVSRLFLWGLLFFSIFAYYVCVLANSIYSNKKKRLKFIDCIWMLGIILIGVIISFVLRENNLGIISDWALVISDWALVSLGELVYLWRKAVV